MTHVVLRRMITLLAVIAVAFPAVGYVQPAVNRAALVVRFENGRVEKACVEFPKDQVTGIQLDEITGIELLERSDIPFIAQSSGMGAAICQIDGEGCAYPNETCFCKSPPDYWALYSMNGGNWVLSGVGASSTKLRNGDVQGWAWGNGSLDQESKPPAIDFASICTIPTTEPTSTPQPSAIPRPSATSGPSATLVPPTAPTATSAPTRIPPVATPRPPPTRTFFPPTATVRPTRVPVVATATARSRPSATREPVAPTAVPPTQTMEPSAVPPNPTVTPLSPTATVRVRVPTATALVLASTPTTRALSSPTDTPPVIVPTAVPVPPPTISLPPTDIPLPTATTDAAFGFSQQTTPVIITGASVVAEASTVASSPAPQTVAPPTMTVKPTPTATSTREVPTVVVVAATTSPSPSPLLVAGGDTNSPPAAPGEASASLPLDPLVFIGVCAALVAIIIKLRRREANQ